MLPEVFCWEARTKNVCDQPNAAGYYVIMPDIMREESMSGVKPEDNEAFLVK